MTDFLNRTIDNLRAGRLGPVVNWVEAHPRLASWIFLGTGMVILLVFAAQDVGLLPGQWAALVIATVLVAGLCIWIVSWEDEDEEQPAVAKAAKPAPKTEAKAQKAQPTPKKSTVKKKTSGSSGRSRSRGK